MQPNHTNRQRVDYFKSFKLFQLKKLTKQGQVKLIQDKTLSRKVLSVQGNVSTQNYITFQSQQITKHDPLLSFSQRYLYVMGYMENSKNFCFQIGVNLNSKIYKVLFSTVYKQKQKQKSNNNSNNKQEKNVINLVQGVIQMPLQMKSGKWTVIVIDLYDICEKCTGANNGNNKNNYQTRVNFQLTAVQIRANSRVKNIYLTDNLYDCSNLPKDMEFPLKIGENFYSVYNYVIVGAQNKQKEQQQVVIVNKSKNNGSKSLSALNSNPEQSKIQSKSVSNLAQQSHNQSRSTKTAINELKLKNNTVRIPNSKKHTQNKSQNPSLLNDQHQPSSSSLIQHQPHPQSNNILPRPSTTLTLNLSSIQGRTISYNSIQTLQSFIIYPQIFPVHNPIKCISISNTNKYKVALGYTDGSIGLWDLIRKKCLGYLKTQLCTLKQIVLWGDNENENNNNGDGQRVFIVGNDRLQRQTILIINQQQVLFKQISNYSIQGFIVCSISKNKNKQDIIVSYGYQNIRLWKLNKSNGIITGMGVYLGKMNRNVTYVSACVIGQSDDGIVLVADNCGYVTKISLISQKMEQIRKISQNALDKIINISQTSSILLCESSGTISLLNYSLTPLQQFELSTRIRNITYKYNPSHSHTSNELILHIEHYNNSTAQFNVNTAQYIFGNRRHNMEIFALKYNWKLGKLVSVGRDGTIRIWGFMVNHHNNNNHNNNNNNNNSNIVNRYPQQQYKIKQQYQFLITNGQIATSLSVDNNVYAYVGFNDGLVRKIDIVKYQIVKEKYIVFPYNTQNNNNKINSNNGNQFVVQSIQVSPNNKHILISIIQKSSSSSSSPHNINAYVILCDQQLNLLYKYSSPSTTSTSSINNNIAVLAGFSETHKKMYINWTIGMINRLQIYDLLSSSGINSNGNLKDNQNLSQNQRRSCVQFYLQCTPVQIRLIQEQVHVDGYNIGYNNNIQRVYQIYSQQSGQITQVYHLNNNNSKHNSNSNDHKIHYPLIYQSPSQTSTLQLSTLYNSNIKQSIDMPQPVNNIIVSNYMNIQQNNNNNNKNYKGMIFCTGKNSHALYAIEYQARNVDNNNCMFNKGKFQKQDKEIYQQFRSYNKNGNKNGNKQRVVDQLPQHDDSQLELQCIQNKLVHFNDYSIQIQQSLSQNQSTNNNNNSNSNNSNRNKNSKINKNMQKTVAKSSRNNNNNNNNTNTFSNTIKSNKIMTIPQQNSLMYQQQYNNQQDWQEKPKQLRGLYDNQQQFFEQCKQFIDPYLKTTQQQQQKSMKNGTQYQSPHKKNSLSSSRSPIQLFYGWHTRYSYSPSLSSPSVLFWCPQSQSTLFLSQRSLILHYFTNPIHQKIVRLPSHPDTIIPLKNNKYIAVSISNQLRLYSPNLQFIRSFISIGQQIEHCALSWCQGYIVILSNSSIGKSNRSYIQIVDVVTSSTLCSTYLQYTNNSKIVINPYQQCLQFILHSPTSLTFYRVSSILTIQTQPLQNLSSILNNTNIGSILSVKYMKLKQQEIILLGMEDGSVVVVDSRSNCVMMLCRKVCMSKIVDILVYGIQGNNYNNENINNKENKPVLVLVTQSNTLIKYTLPDPSLTSLISTLSTSTSSSTKSQQKSYKSILTTDSQITLHSQLRRIGQNSIGMLVMSKFGVLWLVDIGDCETIKILSVHNNNNNNDNIMVNTIQNSTPKITKVIILPPPSNNTPHDIHKYTIITGSQDGTLKQTSLNNLQQQIQIYKPRRPVCDFIVANGMAVVGFGMEVCFYNIVGNNSNSGKGSQWKFIGSINLLDQNSNIIDNSNKSQKIHRYTSTQKITSITSIPYTDNYLILTTQKLFMIYHQKILSLQTNKLKLQIKQICSGFNFASKIDVIDQNKILVMEQGKINVWLRKQKRSQSSVIQQLRDLENLVYYMMDVYQQQAADAKFINNYAMGNYKKIAQSKQYIILLKNRPVIQWRDYEQHCIIKQLQVGVSCGNVIQLMSNNSNNNNNDILIGDMEGMLWRVKENGLTLNKVKVFDSAIQGIEEIQGNNQGNNGGQGKVMVYGASVAIVNI